MEPGDRFGDYVILRRLASGGMAQVYLARKGGMGGFSRPVAMKVILPQHATNKEFIKMFLDEARLAVCLSHANIAQILDLGEVESQYFISMEFAHGEDLQQISKKTRKSGRLLPLPYAAKIVSQIAEGLYYAHTKVDDRGQPLNIVHRDISPHNIILTFDGLAKLIDFGIAKARVTYSEEEEGVLKGKFSYMSPEQIRGMPVDPRSDIFALGIVLWEICTGANLYRESSELLTMEAILRKPVPKPRELRGDMPPDLEAIILKALAKRTVDRFQTAYEMHQALEGYLNRSSWNVGNPHLSEFMKKLFPEEYQEIRDLLEAERMKSEREAAKAGVPFVAWEPYEHSANEDDGDDAGKAAGAVRQPVKPAKPVTDPRIRAMKPAKPATDPAVRSIKPFAEQAENSTKPARSKKVLLLVVILAILLGAGAIVVLSLSGGGGGSSKTPSTGPAPKNGVIHVESEPADAMVFVNGKPIGRTPLDVKNQPLEEDLTVRLEKDGFEPFILPVRLSGARPKDSVKAELHKL